MLRTFRFLLIASMASAFADLLMGDKPQPFQDAIKAIREANDIFTIDDLVCGRMFH